MPLLEMIGRMSMFEHFSEDEKKAFAEMEHSILEFSQDENIITEGEAGKSLFLLIEGTCLITKTADNAKIQLSKLSPGEIFGEMSFFSEQLRQSSVTAKGDVKVLKMDDDFFKKADSNIRERIKEHLIKLLINRLDNMNAAIMRISKLMRA
ncbi:MAG: cyclic nucleotide-binding domain-containing protein [Desulfobacteraceae bacterium]|nr:cyclic nucleotide-binding domain-containing protein [Desulfobacteraceae bacterium]